MSAEDFDKTQELIEQTNAEEAKPELCGNSCCRTKGHDGDHSLLADIPIKFEILVQASPFDWPPACEGVKPVLAAVQRLLVSASEGKEGQFDAARYSLDEAVSAWHSDLFGEKP